MAADTPQDTSTTTVEQAINRVLQAEREAEQAVEACRERAMQIRQAAQQRAARIASRANERLALCHMRCNSRVGREIRERERQAAGGTAESRYRLDADALAPVVEALARILTGVTAAGSQPGDS